MEFKREDKLPSTKKILGGGFCVVASYDSPSVPVEVAQKQSNH